MENKRDYLTIAEYAAIQGVSKQAVYQRLDGSLKPFLKVIKGQKVLDFAALPEEKKKELEQDSSQDSSQDSIQRLINLEQQEIMPNVPGNDSLIQILPILEQQLKEKDKQIERLQEEIKTLHTAAAEKDKHIQEQAAKLSELLEQAQELNKNNQILIARTQEPPLLEDGERKKGFFSRLFKRQKEE